MVTDEEVPTPTEQRQLSRRALVRTLGGGAVAAAAGLALPQGHAQAFRMSPDISILNFALNLEYLEAEFYLYATTGAGLAAADTSGFGRGGPTTGGQRVTFTDPVVAAIATEIAADEVAHVRFLRAALGLGTAASKPAINLNALGIGFGSQTEFLILARAFEDVGVSAYGGAAPDISNRTFLAAAARILATEAYHAGNIREQLVLKNITAPAVDGQDQPPSISNFFPTDSNGLSIVRSVGEVLAIVRPFFPNGLNAGP